MNPEERNPNGGTRDVQAQQAAAADVIRSQIGNLYDDGKGEPSTSSTPQSTEENPYTRTRSTQPLPQAEQWKEYHSAWQNYYQKYYENFYTAQAAKPSVIGSGRSRTQQKNHNYFASKAAEAKQAASEQESAEELSNDQALFELRQKLLGRVQQSAKKIRKSRHFVPIISAFAVVAIFVFVQYNQVITANVLAYVSPGKIDPQNIVIDPAADIVVSKDPRLVIPKINVDVPVAYDVGTDNDSQMAAMMGGLAHFPIAGANSHPGEVGNTVLAGHSSNDLFDMGDYKFIFAQLEKLTVGDSIYANYNGVRYTYIVTKTEVVAPTNVSALIYPTTKPILTLITCTPLGTALNRLLVTAEQVSPNPDEAASAPTGSGTPDTTTTTIPGDNGNLFRKLFGI